MGFDLSALKSFVEGDAGAPDSSQTMDLSQATSSQPAGTGEQTAGSSQGSATLSRKKSRAHPLISPFSLRNPSSRSLPLQFLCSHFVIIQQVIAARLPSLLAGIASPTPHQSQKSRTSLQNPKDRTLNLTLTQATRTKTSFAPTPLAVAGPAKMAWNSTKKATTATTATARATQIQTEW